MSTPDRARAIALDKADSLAPFLERFVPPPEGIVYFDGNSLGQLPHATREALRHTVDVEWGERLIRSWSEGWMELPFAAGDLLGTELLGAAPGQTVLADSTTVNFFKLASAALTARPDRTRILTDHANFPTDRYVVESLALAHHRQIDWLTTDPAGGPEPDAVEALIAEDTALVTFSHVAYRSAHIADMRAITELAHARGALVLWDLSHSVGALPLALDDEHVDLATGCTYKYLNGGPGAPAFLYVNHALQSELAQPIWGWTGRRDPFAMAPGYLAGEGIAQMLSGTPHVLGLTAAREGIALSAEATIAAIRAKSTLLTGYAIELADAILAPHGVGLGSPRDPARRGGHVSLTHPDARRLCERLIDAGVIPDFREPDVIRVGLSPLTTRFVDVHEGLTRLAALLR
ncbi:MAG TPA: kynureninase [Solirubrobacteraceae bacterium]|nr:kynureninase [Solirubrobacteraceae bacterium]